MNGELSSALRALWALWGHWDVSKVERRGGTFHVIVASTDPNWKGNKNSIESVND